MVKIATTLLSASRRFPYLGPQTPAQFAAKIIKGFKKPPSTGVSFIRGGAAGFDAPSTAAPTPTPTPGLSFETKRTEPAIVEKVIEEAPAIVEEVIETMPTRDVTLPPTRPTPTRDVTLEIARLPPPTEAEGQTLQQKSEELQKRAQIESLISGGAGASFKTLREQREIAARIDAFNKRVELAKAKQAKEQEPVLPFVSEFIAPEVSKLPPFGLEAQQTKKAISLMEEVRAEAAAKPPPDFPLNLQPIPDFSKFVEERKADIRGIGKTIIEAGATLKQFPQLTPEVRAVGEEAFRRGDIKTGFQVAAFDIGKGKVKEVKKGAEIGFAGLEIGAKAAGLGFVALGEPVIGSLPKEPVPFEFFGKRELSPGSFRAGLEVAGQLAFFDAAFRAPSAIKGTKALRLDQPAIDLFKRIQSSKIKFTRPIKTQVLKQEVLPFGKQQKVFTLKQTKGGVFEFEPTAKAAPITTPGGLIPPPTAVALPPVKPTADFFPGVLGLVPRGEPAIVTFKFTGFVKKRRNLFRIIEAEQRAASKARRPKIVAAKEFRRKQIEALRTEFGTVPKKVSAKAAKESFFKELEVEAIALAERRGIVDFQKVLKLPTPKRNIFKIREKGFFREIETEQILRAKARKEKGVPFETLSFVGKPSVKQLKVVKLRGIEEEQKIASLLRPTKAELKSFRKTKFERSVAELGFIPRKKLGFKTRHMEFFRGLEEERILRAGLIKPGKPFVGKTKSLEEIERDILQFERRSLRRPARPRKRKKKPSEFKQFIDAERTVTIQKLDVDFEVPGSAVSLARGLPQRPIAGFEELELVSQPEAFFGRPTESKILTDLIPEKARIDVDKKAQPIALFKGFKAPGEKFIEKDLFKVEEIGREKFIERGQVSPIKTFKGIETPRGGIDVRDVFKLTRKIKEAEITSEILKIVPRQTTRTFEITRPFFKLKELTKPREAEPLEEPIPFTPPEFKPKKGITKKQVDVLVRGFAVFEKRRGKFQRVGTEVLPKLKATLKALKRAEETAAATVKAVPTGERVRPGKGANLKELSRLLSRFRKGKGGTFVERRRFRISTKGELEEITFAPRKKKAFKGLIPNFKKSKGGLSIL